MPSISARIYPFLLFRFPLQRSAESRRPDKLIQMAASQLPSGVCRIAGKVALITGGASGLGRGVAQRFVRSGAKVVIADLPSSDGKEVVASLGSHNALFLPTDVTSEEQVRETLSGCKTKFRRLDIVANCASVRGLWNTIGESEPHDYDVFKHIVEVELSGVFNVVRLSAALMNENEPDGDYQKGVFINALSEAAYDGRSGQVAMAAAQGGVAAMTLLLARDLATIGVRCVSIAPEILDSLDDESDDDEGVPLWETRSEAFARLAENVAENPMINGTVIKMRKGKTEYEHWQEMRNS